MHETSTFDLLTTIRVPGLGAAVAVPLAALACAFVVNRP